MAGLGPGLSTAALESDSDLSGNDVNLSGYEAWGLASTRSYVADLAGGRRDHSPGSAPAAAAAVPAADLGRGAAIGGGEVRLGRSLVSGLTSDDDVDLSDDGLDTEVARRLEERERKLREIEEMRNRKVHCTNSRIMNF